RAEQKRFINKCGNSVSLTSYSQLIEELNLTFRLRRIGKWKAIYIKQKILEWLCKIAARTGGHRAECIAMIGMIECKDFRSVFTQQLPILDSHFNGCFNGG